MLNTHSRRSMRLKLETRPISSALGAPEVARQHAPSRDERPQQQQQQQEQYTSRASAASFCLRAQFVESTDSNGGRRHTEEHLRLSADLRLTSFSLVASTTTTATTTTSIATSHRLPEKPNGAHEEQQELELRMAKVGAELRRISEQFTANRSHRCPSLQQSTLALSTASWLWLWLWARTKARPRRPADERSRS